MAIRRKLQDGSGSVGQLPPIALKDGKLTEKLALAITDKMGQLIDKFNNGLSLGTGESGYQAGNLDAQFIDVLMPGVADTEIAIPHGLSRVPIGFLVVNKDRACNIYNSSLGSWSNTIMYLKSNVASATIRLLVF